MKTLFAILLFVTPLALAHEKELNCDDHNWGNNRSYCEMRETTIAARGDITVDGMTNGGISVKGWDRSEILVRSQVSVWDRDPAAAKDIAAHVRAGNRRRPYSS